MADIVDTFQQATKHDVRKLWPRIMTKFTDA